VLSVNVIPAAINFLEATVFAKTMAFAVNLEAGNKLNTVGVVVRATGCRGAYTEPKPALTFVKKHLTGARIGSI